MEIEKYRKYEGSRKGIRIELSHIAEYIYTVEQ
jgi:hypothetical protein